MEESLRNWVKVQLRFGFEPNDISETMDKVLQELGNISDYLEAIRDRDFRP